MRSGRRSAVLTRARERTSPGYGPRDATRSTKKDLANTPTAIACGWRLYEDVERLTSLAGQVVTIDLLHGGCHVDGEPMDPPLGLTQDVSDWICARFDRDGVPAGWTVPAFVDEI